MPGDVQEGSLVGGAFGETATVGVDDAEASDCACLARFLAAALVCQPHVHGSPTEDVKKDLCLHFLIAAIAAKTSLLDGFWPLPVNTGLPSASARRTVRYRGSGASATSRLPLAARENLRPNT